MKIKEGFMLRNVADNYVVVPMGKEAADFNGMITLNETGAFMWKCLEKGCTKDELVAKVLEEYEAEKEQVLQSVERFVKEIEENGFAEK